MGIPNRPEQVVITARGLDFLQTADGRWHPCLGDETLGSYADPISALEALVHDGCFSIPGCADTSVIGLPHELADWALHKRH
jgi:hypothetical protein